MIAELLALLGATVIALVIAAASAGRGRRPSGGNYAAGYAIGGAIAYGFRFAIQGSPAWAVVAGAGGGGIIVGLAIYGATLAWRYGKRQPIKERQGL